MLLPGLDILKGANRPILLSIHIVDVEWHEMSTFDKSHLQEGNHDIVMLFSCIRRFHCEDAVSFCHLYIATTTLINLLSMHACKHPSPRQAIPTSATMRNCSEEINELHCFHQLNLMP